MQRTTIALVLVLVLALIAGFLAWSQIQKLGGQVAELGGQVGDLGQRLEVSETRADDAERRADRAEEEAEDALMAAAEASARERVSAEEARLAEIARRDAEAREQQAAADRQAAEARADDEAVARAQAEETAAAAQRREAELVLQTVEAQTEARRARAETERIRRRMDRELNRLQRALGRIADTRRTALGLVMTLDSSQIEFDFDKAELRPENREVLSRIAGVLMTFDDFGMQIYGHTDDVGSVEYNQALSDQRAEAVAAYLVEAGIPEGVLATKGLGKTSPLVEGTDDEARQRNRRVELAIVFSEGEYESLAEDPEGVEVESAETPDP